MLQLDNITTQDAYPDKANDPAGSLSDNAADLLSLDVGRADVYVSLRRYDPERQNVLPWGSDQRIPAPAHRLIGGVAGVRVRSAIPGTPALVTAQLFQPSDVRPVAGSAAVQVLTTVGQLGLQHNGKTIGSESTVDLVDDANGQGIPWTVADDAPAGTLTVGLAIAQGSFATGPPTTGLVDGMLWIATDVDANGAVCVFRYNAGSASPYKWERIGGGKLFLAKGGGQLVGSGWQSDAPYLGTLTLEREGDYIAEGWASDELGGTSTALGLQFLAASGSLGTVTGGYASLTGEPHSVFRNLSTAALLEGVTAGTQITLQHYSDAAFYLYYRGLKVRPKRVV